MRLTAYQNACFVIGFILFVMMCAKLIDPVALHNQTTVAGLANEIAARSRTVATALIGLGLMLPGLIVVIAKNALDRKETEEILRE